VDTILADYSLEDTMRSLRARYGAVPKGWGFPHVPVAPPPAAAQSLRKSKAGAGAGAEAEAESAGELEGERARRAGERARRAPLRAQLEAFYEERDPSKVLEY
jgi:hypothetical protein